MNHHEVLGVSSSADAGEIKRAFRQAAQEIHPDHSDSPEAAIAFARIKEARDALLERADTGHNANSIAAATAHAVNDAARAGFTPPVATPVGPTDEEIAQQQKLDQQAVAGMKFSLFRRRKESAEVKRHRQKIKTTNRRIMGKY